MDLTDTKVGLEQTTMRWKHWKPCLMFAARRAFSRLTYVALLREAVAMMMLIQNAVSSGLST